jgi:ferredoxin
LSELSLVPGVLGTEESLTTASREFNLPTTEQVREYLGASHEYIDAPTPSQEMVFSRKRRRVPRWMDPDQPCLNNVRKPPALESLEQFSSSAFFYDHLTDLSVRAFAEFSRLFYRSYSALQTCYTEDATELIITKGALTPRVLELVESCRSRKNRVGVIGVRMIRPFPGAELVGYLRGKKAITILESLEPSPAGVSQLARDVRMAVSKGVEESIHSRYSHSSFPELRPKDTPRILEGRICTERNKLSVEGFELILENMRSRDAKAVFVQGIEFSGSDTSLPKREILAQSVSRSYPDLHSRILSSRRGNSLETDPSSCTDEILEFEAPFTIRHYKDKGPAYSRLSGFYERVGCDYAGPENSDLSPDPLQSIRSIPAAASSVRPTGFLSNEYATVDPQACTGCSDCLQVCPTTALRPRVLSIEETLRSALDIASSKGTARGVLSPQLKNLGQFASRAIRKTDSKIQSVADFLPEAFTNLCEQLKIEGDKGQELEAEVGSITEILDHWPVSRTDWFFDNPEDRNKGSGKLFSLFADPWACTGCGACTESCEEGAISQISRSDASIDSATHALRLWETLPDTAGDVISEVFENPEYDSFGAVSLSRSFSLPVLGGDPSKREWSFRRLVRLLASILESCVQPAVAQLLKESLELTESISTMVRTSMAENLPSGDLASLSEVLDSTKVEHLDLSDLLSKIGAHPGGEILNLKVLRRRIHLLEELKKLRWILQEGPTGVGRSRFQMILEGSNAFRFGQEFPDNPFCFPVYVDWEDDGLEVSRGLILGEIRGYLDNIRVLRRARLEAKNNYDPLIHEQEIASLGFDELIQSEQAAFPVPLVVCSSSSLREKGISSACKLLQDELPVKLVVLDDLRVGISDEDGVPAGLSELSLMGTSLGGFVFQGSMADSQYAATGILSAIRYPGPALIQLFDSNPGEFDGSGLSWKSVNELAHFARYSPNLIFDPAKEGGLSQKFDYSRNPDPENDFSSMELGIHDGTSKLKIEGVTLAHLAAVQARFQRYFKVLGECAADQVELHLYLDYELDKRPGHTPIITLPGPQGSVIRLAVSKEMVRASERTLDVWRMARETGGYLTPLREQLRENLKAEYDDQLERERDALRLDYEAKLNALERESFSQAKSRLAQRLLELSSGAESGPGSTSREEGV